MLDFFSLDMEDSQSSSRQGRLMEDALAAPVANAGRCGQFLSSTKLGRLTVGKEKGGGDFMGEKVFSGVRGTFKILG